MSSILTGDALFDKDVLSEIWRLRVQEEARKRLEIERIEKLEIPKGVLDTDPLPKEPPQLIDGLLLSHGATGIIAEKEAGKSLCALEIQHSLITGEPLWGRLKPNKVVNKTVHIIAEHTYINLLQLLARTELSKTGKLQILGPEHLGSQKLLVSSGVRREQAVSSYKKAVAGAGLIVFDPIAAFIQGQAAENDNAPMRTLVDTFIEIAQSTGAACLVLGHQGKPQFVAGRPLKKDRYATRGASSIEDALTAVHYLERVPGQKLGGKRVFTLKPIHFKGVKREEPFHLLRDERTCRQELCGPNVHFGVSFD